MTALIRAGNEGVIKTRSPAKEREPFFFMYIVDVFTYDFVRFFHSCRDTGRGQNAFTPPSSPRNVCLRPRRESLVIQIYLSLPIIWATYTCRTEHRDFHRVFHKSRWPGPQGEKLIGRWWASGAGFKFRCVLLRSLASSRAALIVSIHHS